VIPIECLAVMFFRLILSVRANHLLFYGSVGIFIFNVAADYVFKSFFGVDGIVAATVMNQAISLCFLVWLWRRQWNRRFAPCG
jgi:peptidoglycan biosynthesis protein MviN/MurJ (putative lipid II flippase)